jgi:hypothetical protein
VSNLEFVLIAIRKGENTPINRAQMLLTTGLRSCQQVNEALDKWVNSFGRGPGEFLEFIIVDNVGRIARADTFGETFDENSRAIWTQWHREERT